MIADQELVKQIFIEALAKDSMEQRAAFLNEACGSDQELRAAVDEFLDAHDEMGDFLYRPLVCASYETADGNEESEAVGSMIGDFKLVRLLGVGGFGDVYLAEQQQPIRRSVALKVIKLGMDTKQVIARFEAERQALALMDHPNIAKVLDAGATETGRPYFVMEFVEGEPITDFCDELRLTAEQRLGIFVDVCRALQHAHQKGIIHRDLKPTNVMVTRQDGRPTPKLIDFGVAKATQQRLTEKTLFTTERQLIGTPAYMSPEQAAMGDADVDTRSDIYSLGVLLYELLVGTTPFDGKKLRSKAYDEICRMIRESDPPTPSRRLSTLGDSSADVTQRRQIELAEFQRLLRGDLDAIVMKSLEKERSRRYATAHDLEQDILRYLHNDPVQARRPSTFYQIQKLAHKHRGAFAAAVGVLAVLVVASMTSTTLYLRAKQQRKRADANAAEVEMRSGQTRQALYVSDINTAYQAWNDAELWRVEQLLSAHVPLSGQQDLRGFEWHFLNGMYEHHVDAPRLDHEGEAVRTLALSPDGRLLATGTVKKIWLWDLAERKLVRALAGSRRGRISQVTFSPDGRLLASANGNRTASLWDVTSGKQLHTLKHVGIVNAVTFTKDGQQLVSGGGGISWGKVRFWNVATGELEATIDAHEDQLLELAISPDGQTIVSTSWDRTVKVWDLATGQLRRRIRTPNAVLAVAFSPDGAWFAYGGTGLPATVLRLDTDQEQITLGGDTPTVSSLAFAPDGQRLAGACLDNEIRVWDATTGELLETLRGHTGRATCVGFAPGGSKMLSGGDDGAVRFWEPQSPPSSTDHDSDWAAHVAIHPLGTMLAVGCGRWRQPTSAGGLRLWDVQTQNARLLMQTPSAVYGVAFSPSGDALAASDGSGALALWDTATGTQLWRHVFDGVRSTCVRFAPDGNSLAVGDGTVSDGRVRQLFNSAAIKFLDVATGELKYETDLPGSCAITMAYSPAGDRLAVGGGQWGTGMIHILDANTGSVIDRFQTMDLVIGVDFSTDGRQLAIADFRSGVWMWEVNSHQPPAHWARHAFIHDVAFSPDGRTLASGSRTGTVKLWNVATGKELTRLSVGAVPAFSLAFSQDGSALAAACGDGSLVQWRDGQREQLPWAED